LNSKFILCILIKLCFLQSLFANDLDTIVLKTGKSITGIAYDLNSKTITLTQVKNWQMGMSYEISLDSISRYGVDSSYKKIRYLLEHNIKINTFDQTEVNRLYARYFKSKRHDLGTYFNIELLNTLNLAPFITYEIGQTQDNGFSLILAASYRFSSKNLVRYNLKNYQFGIGTRKYQQLTQEVRMYFEGLVSIIESPIFTTLHTGIYKYNPHEVETAEVGYSASLSMGFQYQLKPRVYMNAMIGVNFNKCETTGYKINFRNGVELCFNAF
jgi:hypothetical protein